MKLQKLFYLSFVVIVFAALTWFYIKKPHPTMPPPSSVPITVETTQVREIIVADQVETVGNLKSLNAIDITSELSGQIKALHFKSGDRVKKGDLLIELDNTILKSEWHGAKASLALSENNYQRYTKLAQNRMAAAQALDVALADYKDKKNQLAIKEAQLKKMSLRAPFSGKLGSRRISVGQYVTVGEPLVKLVANQTLRVEYHLPERYISKLSKGQMVSITSDAYPHETFNATVSYIDPIIDEESRSIAIEALLDNNKSKLSPGLFIHVNHKFSGEKKRLLVPEESLIPTISGQKLFILKGNTAVSVNVSTGSHHAEMTEVLEGLTLSDTIVVRGQHKLKNGANVIDVRKG